MKDNRPVNLEINTIWLPIPAICSILHRISGVAIFFGTAILLYLLQGSLADANSFEATKALIQQPLMKLIVWLVLCGFIYHICAGVRHIFMDFGLGETREGGKKTAIAVFVASIVLAVLAGVWLV